MITPSQTVTEYTTISSFYVPSLISNVPPSLPGVLNCQSGGFYESSVSISFTQLTLEAWVYMTSVPAGGGAGSLFDNRYVGQGPNTPNCLQCGVDQAGKLEVGNSVWGASFSGTAVPLNSWTHVAYVFNNYLWTGFVNGVQVGTINDTSGLPYSPTLHMGIALCPPSASYVGKFIGNVFQPMITTGIKYSSNFTPATDLSVGASSHPVVFFMNPGITANTTDLATGNIVLGENGATATGFRYLG